jgi:hypothetical protein
VRELRSAGVAGYVNEYSAPQQIVPSLAPYLFPHQFDRRAGPRVPLSVTASYRAGDQIASALTLSLAKDGLGLGALTPLATGTPVVVRFRLPGEAFDVEAGARVCWADRSRGMGLQFERLSSGDQAAIERFVDAHEPA